MQAPLTPVLRPAALRPCGPAAPRVAQGPSAPKGGRPDHALLQGQRGSAVGPEAPRGQGPGTRPWMKVFIATWALYVGHWATSRFP